MLPDSQRCVAIDASDDNRYECDVADAEIEGEDEQEYDIVRTDDESFLQCPLNLLACAPEAREDLGLGDPVKLLIIEEDERTFVVHESFPQTDLSGHLADRNSIPEPPNPEI
jgi:hypothetical protein